MNLLSHALVPVANEADARKTARAFGPYDAERITVLYVVEKAGGAPDKTPVSQSEELGEAAFKTFRQEFPEAETEITYAANVAEAIFEMAREREASAIVYRSRGGNRLMHLLSGDLSLKLVTRSPVPVVALPVEGEESDGTE